MKISTQATLKENQNFQAKSTLTFIIILLMMVLSSGTMLEIQPILSNNGYVEINTDSRSIVLTSDLITHIVDPNEILYILNNITKYVFSPTQFHYYTLSNQLEILKGKVRTLIPKNNENYRTRRGLINAIGSINKYLFGTMDEVDRKDIEKHLAITDTNLHNTITNLNHQIKINDYFSNTFKELKSSVNEQKEQLKKFMDKTDKIMLLHEQMLKINILKYLHILQYTIQYLFQNIYTINRNT